MYWLCISVWVPEGGGGTWAFFGPVGPGGGGIPPHLLTLRILKL